MCGILGYIGPVLPELRARFSAALQTIAHRGPDAHSIWSDSGVLLGHRRLSIIDLSSAATQPMVDPDSGCVIVFNGEIYNYLELRAELVAKGARFRTQSDTEVLLRGYLHWGPEILQRANGMWAFAIWDPAKEELLLARDRFGVKPIYYCTQRGSFAFASEPKALHALLPSTLDINSNAIIDLFAASSIHAGERTFYRQISALPPAHYLVLRAGDRGATPRRYWDYPKASDELAPANSSDLEEFTHLFEDAVRLRMRSDVPVGLTLSGGLDSSSILAAAKTVEGSALRSYTSTYGGEETGERDWAELAAGLAGGRVSQVESLPADWLTVIEQVVHHMDAPGYSPAVLPLWSLMAKARADNVPVLLEGQGADELLTGYPRYSAINFLQKLKTFRPISAFRSFQKMAGTFTLPWTAAWIGRTAFPSLSALVTRDRRLQLIEPGALTQWRAQGPDPTLSAAGEAYDPLRKALWQDHSQLVLPALLHYGDAISMAHGIESRLPFMDYRLVEWVFRAKPELMASGSSKSLVREYLVSRNFQPIAERRDKKGYPVPLKIWYARFGREQISATLADRAESLWGILDVRGVRALSDQADSGSTIALFHLYKVFTTSIWMRQIAGRRVQVPNPVHAAR
jgi:asparagine synthase (glutamine-hydrolysing)